MSDFDAERRRTPRHRPGDRDGWMDPRALSDQELEELLSGHLPEDRPELRPVADLAASLRARAGAEPVPVMRYELRRSLAARAAAPAPAPGRRRLRDAVGMAAALLAFGAVSAAGALPAPLREAAADAAGIVGVNLTRASEGTAPLTAPERLDAAPDEGEPGSAQPEDARTPEQATGRATADDGVPDDPPRAAPEGPQPPADPDGPRGGPSPGGEQPPSVTRPGQAVDPTAPAPTAPDDPADADVSEESDEPPSTEPQGARRR